MTQLLSCIMNLQKNFFSSMFPFHLTVFLSLCGFLSGRHKCKGNQPYFDQNDFFDAECINTEAVQEGYLYLGNKNQTDDGRECAPWNHVWHYFELKGSNDYPKIHERQSHSYCRQVEEYKAHPTVFNFSFDGSQIPWCYAYAKDRKTLEPASCFKPCVETCVPEDPEVKRPAQVVDPPDPNYNEEILDDMVHYFKEYNWGSDENVHLYYDELQSTSKHSETLYKARTGVFFGVSCALLIVCLYYLLSCCLKRRARKSRDKKDAEKAKSDEPPIPTTTTEAASKPE